MVTTIAAHEHPLVGSREREGTEVTWHVSWRFDQPKTSIAEEVMSSRERTERRPDIILETEIAVLGMVHHCTCERRVRVTRPTNTVCSLAAGTSDQACVWK